MALTKERRRCYFVDSRVQGAILRQAAYYWLCGSATFTLIVFVYRIAPSLIFGEGLTASRIWYHLGPLAISSAVLFPIVMFTAIRFSNRFVGPMLRMRRTLNQLAEGDAPPSIELRTDDFWSEVALDINRIAERFQQEPPLASPSGVSGRVSREDGAQTLAANTKA